MSITPTSGATLYPAALANQPAPVKHNKEVHSGDGARPSKQPEPAPASETSGHLKVTA